MTSNPKSECSNPAIGTSSEKMANDFCEKYHAMPPINSYGICGIKIMARLMKQVL
jgi:hypothetical protein